MCRTFLLLICSTVLLQSGCAAVDATTDAAKIVGETVYKGAKATARVAVAPIREIGKIHEESKSKRASSVATAKKGDSDPESTVKVTSNHQSDGEIKQSDGEIKLAKASEDDEPPPARKRKTRAAEKEASDTSLDESPPVRRKAKDNSARTDDDDDSGGLAKTAEESNRNSKWQARTAARSNDSDPDTIKIE